MLSKQLSSYIKSAVALHFKNSILNFGNKLKIHASKNGTVTTDLMVLQHNSMRNPYFSMLQGFSCRGSHANILLRPSKFYRNWLKYLWVISIFLKCVKRKRRNLRRLNTKNMRQILKEHMQIGLKFGMGDALYTPRQFPHQKCLVSVQTSMSYGCDFLGSCKIHNCLLHSYTDSSCV